MPQIREDTQLGPFPLIVGGEPVEPAAGEYFDVYNPATGTVLTQVARAREADVQQAVAAARAAFESKVWWETTPAERGRMLLRAAQLVRERREEFARLETLDTGKPISQARVDADVAARYFEFYGGAADKLMGTTIPVSRQVLDYTVREPWGVCVVITPWNYPMQIVARNLAAGIAAGNALVVKPAEQAPLTSMRLGDIVMEAGAPAGIVNILPGYGPEAGAPLVTHPGVDHIHFTGSVATGARISEAAAANVTPVSLELGGKSPQVIFADADLDQAVPTVMKAMFQHAGQTCSAGSRVVVERRVHDQVIEALVRRIADLRVGPGMDDPDLGPVVSQEQLQQVLGYIQVGRSEGAHVVAGGDVPADERLQGGYFVAPTLFDQVKPEMRVAQEEIFGPVLTALTFEDEEEALQIANGTPFGLVAGVWTRDVGRAHYLAARIRAGQVFVNNYGAGGGVEMPFGGFKKSGHGREKGMEGLLGYTQVKNVCVQLDR